MDATELTALFGPPIEDPDEETFFLFSETFPSSNLGFIDPRAPSVDVSIGGREYHITQSPGLLSATRAGGTTGAVVWKITPALAAWLTGTSNPLHSILAPHAYVVELGCGVAGVLALALGPRVARYVLTDQAYVARVLRANVEENAPGAWAHGDGAQGRRARPGGKAARPGYIAFETLDWESMAVTPRLTGSPGVHSFDLVVACDCVYNEALVGPLVETCADVCRLRASDTRPDLKPTVCLVAQQLRDPEVFEVWMNAFHQAFETWRVPDEMLPKELCSGSGFAVHIGILRT